MKWSKWLENWGITSIKLNAKFAELEFKPQTEDEDAAWELYVELITRVTTQELLDKDGDEETALKSVYNIFPITREILRKYKRTGEFSKISILVLNQIIRPFTAKWHRESLNNCFEKGDKCIEFRNELKDLQKQIKIFTKMLADMAKVEDLTELENYD